MGFRRADPAVAQRAVGRARQGRDSVTTKAEGRGGEGDERGISPDQIPTVPTKLAARLWPYLRFFGGAAGAADAP